ncbi:MAG: DUF655 domain-containing protein [Candidatus Nanohaloarchaeota archaeon QJJ-9]|nr:DUF655 domain-containing protein [Candidatus Nanohaloarchaeota archaeon QJJ-9]
MKDENAIVLDYLEHGKPSGRKDEPLAQIIGKKYFNLLEVGVREGKHLKAHDEVYIGEGKRDDVKYIKGRIKKEKLTGTAKSELDYVLNDLIEENEDRFVNFFNNAQPITTRQHSLELIPSVGEKHMWEIIEERDKEEFESFDDLQERVSLMPDPRKLLRKRIKKELEGGKKHYLFVPPPKSEDRDKFIQYD